MCGFSRHYDRTHPIFFEHLGKPKTYSFPFLSFDLSSPPPMGACDHVEKFYNSKIVMGTPSPLVTHCPSPLFFCAGFFPPPVKNLSDYH